MSSKKVLFILGIGLIICIITIRVILINAHKSPTINTTLKDGAFKGVREKTKVTFIFDGDTIELADKRAVRLIGIDAPEYDKKTHQPNCFAEEAKNLMIQLLNGQMVEMEKDVEDMDKYGRFLRYIYLDDVFINDFFLRQGFAKIMTIPPDTKYSQQFEEAEKEAIDNNRGLWKSCE